MLTINTTKQHITVQTVMVYDTLIIDGINIRRDEAGRYCLNDLHRAAGGEKRHQPLNWLRTQQTIDLIGELTVPHIRGTEQNQPVRAIQGGNNQGTFVVKELVYSYAMWISAAFNLKVIRAYDAMVTGGLSTRQAPALPHDYLSALEALTAELKTRIALEHKVEEQTSKLEEQSSKLEEQAPKVAALERISGSPGTMTLTQAARALEMSPKEFPRFLERKGWIYRQHKGWNPYSHIVKAGYAERRRVRNWRRGESNPINSVAILFPALPASRLSIVPKQGGVLRMIAGSEGCRLHPVEIPLPLEIGSEVRCNYTLLIG